MDDYSFVYCDEAQCPCCCKANPDVIGNSVYRCNCGCEFEWYDEHSWFILRASTTHNVPEQYDISDDTDIITLTEADIVQNDNLKSGFIIAFLTLLLFITIALAIA